MTVKTVNLDDTLITAAEQRAQELSLEYGVTVSFSEVVRRALAAFLLPVRSIDRPKDYEKTSTDIAV
ncbi:MAG: hypothetical protein IPP13_21795 [Kouleothrix sp.]|jgi:hypothetical protein|nr:hypothetical protein [Kouleothrix sp.]